jgi:ribosomal protein S18 acetylase RimI-like enzyme
MFPVQTNRIARLSIMSRPIIRIRLARRRDAPALVAFNSAMALETEAKLLFPNVIGAGVRALLARPASGFYVVAQCNAQVIGALLITKEWSDWRNGDFWWVQSVYVLPEHRGRGVYRRLYRHVQRLAARRRSVVGFRLYVDHDNARARRVYRSLGMKQTRYAIFEQLKRGVRFYQPKAAAGSSPRDRRARKAR